MRVKVIPESCMGCGLCQVYCATAHSHYPGSVWKAYKLSTQPVVPRLNVERSVADVFSVPCRHCEEPFCVAACITGAMQKDSETGIVAVDEDRCVACATCVVACPYGAVYMSREVQMIAKCDLCQKLGQTPACVQNCPNEALVIEEGS